MYPIIKENEIKGKILFRRYNKCIFYANYLRNTGLHHIRNHGRTMIYVLDHFSRCFHQYITYLFSKNKIRIKILLFSNF